MAVGDLHRLVRGLEVPELVKASGVRVALAHNAKVQLQCVHEVQLLAGPLHRQNRMLPVEHNPLVVLRGNADLHAFVIGPTRHLGPLIAREHAEVRRVVRSEMFVHEAERLHRQRGVRHEHEFVSRGSHTRQLQGDPQQLIHPAHKVEAIARLNGWDYLEAARADVVAALGFGLAMNEGVVVRTLHAAFEEPLPHIDVVDLVIHQEKQKDLRLDVRGAFHGRNHLRALRRAAAEVRGALTARAHISRYGGAAADRCRRDAEEEKAVHRTPARERHR
mmetsp:Transcript_29324/g.84266  ORF Transcript_29324/g.84266 Transcript_29324/m.84266 type:complete len:276 (-) Transcript_29324:172-999(-)